MLKGWMIAGVVIVWLCAGAYAQEEKSVNAVADNAITQKPALADALANVSLDFRDADIANVLKILSFKSGVNIVVGPEVTGLVTIQLHDVPWKQALEVVLETYGYAFEQKGNIITVTTVENLKQRRENTAALAEQEPVETRTFTLNFGVAKEIIVSIEKMKSERGSINYDERTNTLIVTDISKRLDLMEGVIKKLDRTTPQVMIEAKIVETNFSNEENLGIDWTTQASLGGSSRPVSWPFKTGSTDNRFAGHIPIPSTVDSGSYAAAASVSYGTLNFTQFQAVLELLKTKTDTNILSNPKIVTLDNREAKITVSETRHLVTNVTTNAQTGQTESTIGSKDVGIIFSVTPHVNGVGFVTLDVEPEVSEVTGDNDTIDGNAIPVIAKKTAKTSIMVKGGETLVIGGLVKDRIVDTRKKVPLIGDIPIFGLLFQKSEKTNAKTDLMIFITPHIITPDVGS